VANLKNIPFKYKKHISIAVSVFFLLLFIPFCSPIFNTSQAGLTQIAGRTLEFKLDNPKTPKISDYLIVNIKAKNIGSVDFPAGSVRVRWKYAGQDEFETTSQQKFKIFIDGISHNYYVPTGENKYWAEKTQNKISHIKIDIPEAAGVKISVNNIVLKERILPSLDSYINYLSKNTFNIEHTNRFLTPAYIFLAVLLVIYVAHNLLFKRSVKTYKAFLAVLISILIFASFNFMALEACTVKSYWDSYKKYILSGSLSKTYAGFYNFEKFISWLGSRIPEDENIIVLVRGEPIYIMSEIAYNLYPADVKFINISQKENAEILEEAALINFKSQNKYSYIIALSENDRLYSNKLVMVDKYKDSGGFVYKLSNSK